MKKVLIATDSFKESISSTQVAQAIIEGFANNDKFSFETTTLADGGEGTMQLIASSIQAKLINTTSQDPLGRIINTKFAYSKKLKTAIIDVATSSGIELLTENEKNPMHASSYGTGELIKKALDYEPETIILGLGSSATVDLGFGMLLALGYKFLNSEQQEIVISGQNLSQIVSIDDSNVDCRLKNVKFQVACDVDNVLTGENGSCRVFAKQKGATKSQENLLEKQFVRLNKVICEMTSIDLNEVKGSGAAGGIGASAYAFLNGELISGSDLIIEINDIENKVQNCDIVITGEGRFDFQSLHGKGPMSIIKLANKYNKQCIAICGSVDNQIYKSQQLNDVAIFSTITKVDTLENTLSSGYDNIKHTAQAISKLLL